MSKQTAVETLIDNLIKLGYLHSNGFGQSLKVTEVIKQAKEMEKQQIIDAHTKGYVIGGGNGDLYDCKQYYNDNFNK